MSFVAELKQQLIDYLFHFCFLNTLTVDGFNKDNTQKCTLIASLGDLLETISIERFKETLASRSMTMVLQHPELLIMIQTGLLSVEDALYILPKKINPILWGELRNTEEKLKYLKSASVSPHHPENKPSPARLLGASMSAVLAPDFSDFLEEEGEKNKDLSVQLMFNMLQSVQ